MADMIMDDAVADALDGLGQSELKPLAARLRPLVVREAEKLAAGAVPAPGVASEGTS